MKNIIGHSLSRRKAMLMTASFAPLALAGCDDDKKVKITGLQVPVLPVVAPLDPAVDAPPVSVPAAAPLQDWPQYMANTDHAPGNIAGPAGLTQAWRASIGEGGGYRQPLQASPVIADGKVFAMDANGNVTAFSASSGAQIWRTYTRPKHTTVLNIGGGIGYNAGTLYASTGYSELLAIDPASGKINWRQPLDFPARSAPSIGAGLVAVICQNDLLLTFDAASGAPAGASSARLRRRPPPWPSSAPRRSKPASSSPGFSSGTLAALDANSGTPIWRKVSPPPMRPLSVSPISPPRRSSPMAWSMRSDSGGSIKAIDLRSGAKVWERTAAGNQPIYTAGDFIFVLDNSQKLVAIHADDGLVSWAVQIPQLQKHEEKENPPRLAGPMMLNGLLVLTNDHGEIAMIEPSNGSIKSTARLDGPADLPPIAAPACCCSSPATPHLLLIADLNP